MKLTCTVCGASGSLEFFLMDAAARTAVIDALKLPAPLAGQVMAYIGLFRPSGRGLTWDRVEKLLDELVSAISAAEVTRNGRSWVAPVDYWKQALDQMLMGRDKLTLPMKTHGYLFEIVADIANRAEGKRERERERAPRVRDPASAVAHPQPLSKVMDRAAHRQHAATLKHALSRKKQEGNDG